MTRTIDDTSLDSMTETIGAFRELAHAVAHARERGDLDTICQELAEIENLFQATDSELLAAALLEKLFAADWVVCQGTGRLPHLLP